MSKYKYIIFNKEIPNNIKREYNRMLRKEQYQTERDNAHGVYLLSYAPFLHTLADKTLTENMSAGG